MDELELKQALENEDVRSLLFEVLDARYTRREDHASAGAKRNTTMLQTEPTMHSWPLPQLSSDRLNHMAAFLTEHCMVSQKHYSKASFLALLTDMTAASFGTQTAEQLIPTLVSFVDQFLERPEFPLCGDSKNRANPPDTPISWRGFRFKQVFGGEKP